MFSIVLLHIMLKIQAKVVLLDALYYLHLTKPGHVKTIAHNHTMQTGVLIYVFWPVHQISQISKIEHVSLHVLLLSIQTQ